MCCVRILCHLNIFKSKIDLLNFVRYLLAVQISIERKSIMFSSRGFGTLPTISGPMARSISDAAYVLSIIAGKDQNDNYTLAQPWYAPPHYTQALTS
ncbi:hypothetical protein V8E51_016366 [Hyaloscypha variabilis]